jgi:hypothetical protein
MDSPALPRHVKRQFPMNGAWMPYIFAMKTNERTASACKIFRYKTLLLDFPQSSYVSGFHTCGCPRKRPVLRRTPNSCRAATYRTRRARESRWKARGHCANSRLLTLPEIRDDLLVRRAKSTGTHGRYGYLVPFQLVEFYAQSGEARNALYVSC